MRGQGVLRSFDTMVQDYLNASLVERNGINLVTESNLSRVYLDETTGKKCIDKVTCGSMVSHGYTWFHRLHEVTWFHVVSHGCKGYKRSHGYLWFRKASRVSRGYMVSCGNTW